MRVPTRLPAHRIACLALYRAFLSHLPHLPLEPAQTQFAEWHIRNEFKQKGTAAGIKPIRRALLYGRKGETLMRRAATGDQESITKLSEAITRLQKQREEMLHVATLTPPTPKPPPPPTLMPTRKRKLRLLDPNYKPPPRSPIPRLPQLIESNMFPIMRWPGQKTPVHISMLIKSKTIKKQKRMDVLELLDDWAELAREEDAFDKIIQRETGIREGGGTWEQGVRDCARLVRDLMRQEDLRGVEKTKKFLKIIEEKKVIRDAMIVERDKEKRRRKRQNRLQRKAEQWRMEAKAAIEAANGELERTPKPALGPDTPPTRYSPPVHYVQYINRDPEPDGHEQGDLEHEYDEHENEYHDQEHGEEEYDNQEYEEYEEHELESAPKKTWDPDTPLTRYTPPAPRNRGPEQDGHEQGDLEHEYRDDQEYGEEEEYDDQGYNEEEDYEDDSEHEEEEPDSTSPPPPPKESNPSTPPPPSLEINPNPEDKP
ncbi:hypothetical protein L873DRAFT_1324867 [Choiromyces venosus 120613-1]|uniref:Uncharacterized protein n=1 Tax=Choiromyces venosus 120613-1 TaxID=1336337 RepID=A0A3N4JAS5_9PEZI|nr:hypothetical protein L873DRAFT_1324867 [Choiromyces venosus 120613-1]